MPTKILQVRCRCRSVKKSGIYYDGEGCECSIIPKKGKTRSFKVDDVVNLWEKK